MKKSPRSDRQNRRGQALVSVWESCIRDGLAARAEYDKRAEEVLAILDPGHASVFRELEEVALDLSEAGVAVSINKAASTLNTLLPQIVQQNPTRNATPHTNDGVWWSVAEMVRAYLNHSAREGNLEDQIKASLVHGLVYGRGLARVGYDEDRGIITSRYLSSRQLAIDPGGTWESAEWIAVRRRAPLWRVKRELYPDKEELRANRWRFEELEKKGREHAASTPGPEDRSDKPSVDLLTLWDVYSKRGHGLGRGPLAPEEFENEDDSNDFVKLVLAEGHDLPLWEGEWELSAYLDAEWPVVKWDPVACEGLDRLWPHSLLGLASANAKAIDLTSTSEMAQVIAASRSVTVVNTDRLADEDALDRLKCGTHHEVFEAKGDEPAPPGGFVETKQLGKVDPAIGYVRQYHTEQLEEVVGLGPSLTGAPPTGSQDRSAAASNLRASGSAARIGDLRNGAELFCSRAARLEALALLLDDLVDEEDVAHACGEAQLGWLVSVSSMNLEMPIRRPARGGLTLAELDPESGTFFPTAKDAAARVEIVQQALWSRYTALPPDLRVRQYVTYPQGPMGPEPAFDVQVRRVTVDDVYREIAGVKPREVVRECYVEVVAGTAQRQDPATKRERGSFYLQYALPIAADLAKTTGNYGPVNEVFAAVDEAYDVPPDQRMKPLPNLPPPPAPAPGPPA